MFYECLIKTLLGKNSPQLTYKGRQRPGKNIICFYFQTKYSKEEEKEGWRKGAEANHSLFIFYFLKIFTYSSNIKKANVALFLKINN